LTLKTFVDLIVGVFFASNLPILHQVSGDESIMNKTLKYPSEEPKGYSKIKFESPNNLTLSTKNKSEMIFLRCICMEHVLND